MSAVLVFFRKNRFHFLYLFFLLFCTVVTVLRRPDAVSNPQFWAEDGTFWYADAYNKGALHTFLIPVAGYLQTVSRIIAAVSMLFPIRSAPLVFNISAIAIQVLPVVIMLSDRMSDVFPSRFTRVLFCLMYLFLPNTREIFINVTNAQWFLAFSALLIVVGRPSKTKAGAVFDALVLILAGLSGPFSIFLFPVALLNWRTERNRSLYVLFSIIVLCAIIQLAFILRTGMGRMQVFAPNTPTLLIKIIARQVVGGAVVGPYAIAWMEHKTAWAQNILNCFAVFGIILFFYASYKAKLAVKLMLVFGSIAFVSSLLVPVITIRSTVSTWQVLSESSGVRYWLLPMVSFLLVVAWASTNRAIQKPFRYLGILFVAGMIFFSTKTYRDNHGIAYLSYPDLEFGRYVQKLEVLPKGKSLAIPINPIGWYMTLKRH